MQDFDFAQI